MSRVPGLDGPRRAIQRRSVALFGLLLAGALPVVQADQSTAPADAFFARVSALCGKAFGGRVVVDQPAPTGADPFAGKALVMHVRDCSATELRIPFNVGDDRSRTWVLTRTAHGLRLKHDHRHEDGSEDAVTMYGGDTQSAGSASRQEFPVDAESIVLLRQSGLEASVTNVWAIEVEPARRLVYELARAGRLFRVEFDLDRPLDPPPASWGASNGK